MARLTSSNFPTYTVNGQTVILDDDIHQAVDHATYLDWRQYAKTVPSLRQMGRVFYATTYIDAYFNSAEDDALIIEDSFWDEQSNITLLYMNMTNAFITTEDDYFIEVQPA